MRRGPLISRAFTFRRRDELSRENRPPKSFNSSIANKSSCHQQAPWRRCCLPYMRMQGFNDRCRSVPCARALVIVAGPLQQKLREASETQSFDYDSESFPLRCFAERQRRTGRSPLLKSMHSAGSHDHAWYRHYRATQSFQTPELNARASLESFFFARCRGLDCVSESGRMCRHADPEMKEGKVSSGSGLEELPHPTLDGYELPGLGSKGEAARPRKA